MILALTKGYPFPAAQTAISGVIQPDRWEPKTYSLDGFFFLNDVGFSDNNANFIADGIAPGDLIFVFWTELHDRFVNRVQQVLSPDFLLCQDKWHAERLVVEYKIGSKNPHTTSTLKKMLREYGKHAYTVHHNTIWTSAPFGAFNYDHTGDAYCVPPA